MAKNKARHILHGVLDCLPIILIPIFMIYSQNHEITGNEIVQETNKVVNFNQLKVNGNFENDYSYYIYENNGTMTVSNNSAHITNASAGSSLVTLFRVLANHWYLISNNFSAPSGIYFSFNGAQQAVTSTGSTQLLQMKSTWETDRNIYFVVVVPTNTFNIDYDISNLQVFDLTQMFGEGNEPTIEQFNTYFPNSYYPYTESEEVVIENYETITYYDTDIMSQSFYCLYNAVDKYFNMGNVFGMKNLYTWFEVNIFGGTASPSIYIVWNIVLYEFVMDLLFLLYGLFMFFIDLCKRLMEKPLNSIK